MIDFTKTLPQLTYFCKFAYIAMFADKNGDGYLDIFELETLFLTDVSCSDKKV